MSTAIYRHDLSAEPELRIASSRRGHISPLSRIILKVPLAIWTRAGEALATWRLHRQMCGMDPSLLRDIGVPSCGLEWAMRNGRERV